MSVCRYCFNDISQEKASAFHRGQVIDPTVCNTCRRDDADDYAGITREEALADAEVSQ